MSELNALELQYKKLWEEIEKLQSTKVLVTNRMVKYHYWVLWLMFNNSKQFLHYDDRKWIYKVWDWFFPSYRDSYYVKSNIEDIKDWDIFLPLEKDNNIKLTDPDINMFSLVMKTYGWYIRMNKDTESINPEMSLYLWRGKYNIFKITL